MRRSATVTAQTIWRMALWAIVLLACLGANPHSAYASSVEDPCTVLEGTNIGEHEYAVSGHVQESYLVEVDGGYMRVQAGVEGHGVVVAYYSRDFELERRFELPEEFPVFGGFAQGEGCYYVATGQDDTEEDADKEVVRVTRYDTSWNRIGQASKKSIYIYQPFYGGACRMVEEDGKLYVYMAKRQFADANGLRHQSDSLFCFDVGKMAQGANAGIEVMVGGHSFAQHLVIDGAKAVEVFQSDSKPKRGIGIIAYDTWRIASDDAPVGGEKCTLMIEVPGERGNMVMGINVGGMAMSSSDYIAVGSSVDQSSPSAVSLQYNTRSTYNVYVATAPRAGGDAEVRWLTDVGEGTTCSNPHIVTIGADRYMLLWTQRPSEKNRWQASELHCRVIDGRGNPVTREYSMEGQLSDCVPIVSAGSLVWYTWDGANETFWRMPLADPEGIESHENAYAHEWSWVGTADGLATFKCGICGDEEEVPVPTSFVPCHDGDTFGVVELDAGQTTELTYKSLKYDKGTPPKEWRDTVKEIAVEVPKGASWTYDERTRTFTFPKAGKYTVRFHPVYNPECVKTWAVNVTYPLESVSIEQVSGSDATYGDEIGLRALVRGGHGTYHKKIALQVTATREGSGEAVSLDTPAGSVKSGDTSYTIKWAPPAAGRWTVAVRAMDASDKSEAEGAPIIVDVGQAAPVVEGAVAADAITYGQSFADAALSGAVFTSPVDGTALAGQLSLDGGPEKPVAGTHKLTWTFTPEDANYAPVGGSVAVEVAKAPCAPGKPDAGYDVPFAVEAIDDGVLAGCDGWSFGEAAGTPIEVGTPVTVKARYVRDDAWCYEVSEADVEVVRLACAHESTRVVGGKEPTCMEAGYTGDSACDTCGEAVEHGVAIPALGHAREEETVKEPTCEEEGLARWRCTRCGEGGEYTISATGHIWADMPTVDAESGCTHEGAQSVKCSACCAVREGSEEAIPATGHEWGGWMPVVDASCDTTGREERRCGVCGEVASREVPAIGHEFTVEKVVQEPTCTEEGMATVSCARCGVEDVSSQHAITALGHAYGAWSVLSRATCVETGTEGRECLRCKHEQTRGIPVVAHDFGAWDVLQEATCLDDGVEARFCRMCGKELTRALPATGHMWGAWRTVIAPTASEEGLKVRDCTGCGKSQEEAIPKKAPTEAKAGQGGADSANPPSANPQADKQATSGAVAAAQPAITAAQAERKIVKMADGKEAVDSTFALLQAKGKAKGKKAVKLTWKKIKGATSYAVYGNKCGKAFKYKKLALVKGSSFTQKKLKGATYYKYVVVALKGDSVLATSKSIHVATAGGKVGNAKAVKTAAKKGSVTLKKGASFKLKAKAVAQAKKKLKKHRAIAYETDNPKVATVTKAGVVKAKAPGTCRVYAYAQDGTAKTIKVTVKR